MLKQRYLCGFAVVGALALATTIGSRAQQAPPPAQQPVPPARGGGPGDPPFEPLPMPEILKQYQLVSADRLKNPPDGEWPMIRRTYDGWGYSPLSQIDTDNVRRLEPVWVFSTGVTNGHEAPRSW